MVGCLVGWWWLQCSSDVGEGCALCFFFFYNLNFEFMNSREREFGSRLAIGASSPRNRVSGSRETSEETDRATPDFAGSKIKTRPEVCFFSSLFFFLGIRVVVVVVVATCFFIFSYGR